MGRVEFPIAKKRVIADCNTLRQSFRSMRGGEMKVDFWPLLESKRRFLMKTIWKRIAPYHVLVGVSPMTAIERLRSEPCGIHDRLFLAGYLQESRFHHKGNHGYEHKILLGEADAFARSPHAAREDRGPLR